MRVSQKEIFIEHMDPSSAVAYLKLTFTTSGENEC